jgi:hypothetical protein
MLRGPSLRCPRSRLRRAALATVGACAAAGLLGSLAPRTAQAQAAAPPAPTTTAPYPGYPTYPTPYPGYPVPPAAPPARSGAPPSTAAPPTTAPPSVPQPSVPQPSVPPPSVPPPSAPAGSPYANPAPYPYAGPTAAPYTAPYPIPYAGPYPAAGAGPGAAPGAGTAPAGPTTKLPPRKPREYRWAVRANPYDLLFRRATVEGEVTVWGPLTIGVAPSVIWDSPDDRLDEVGFSGLASVGVYFQGRAMSGFFLKGIAGFEVFDASATSVAGSNTTVSSGLFGGLLGNQTVFGEEGGFALSGGIGLAVASSDPITLPGTPFSYYAGDSRFRLLGTLGLGVTF